MTTLPDYISDSMEWHSSARCRCGSGNETYRLTDARGIHVTLCCDDCVMEKASGYRPEIFVNGAYDAPDLGEGT